MSLKRQLNVVFEKKIFESVLLVLNRTSHLSIWPQDSSGPKTTDHGLLMIGRKLFGPINQVFKLGLIHAKTWSEDPVRNSILIASILHSSRNMLISWFGVVSHQVVSALSLFVS